MKIIFFLHSFSIGGAERRCAIIANYLAQHGHKIIAVLLDSDNVLFELDKDIEIFYLPPSGIAKKIDPNQNLNCNFEHSKSSNHKEFLRLKKNKITNQQFDEIIDSYSARIEKFCEDYPNYLIISWVSLYSIACAQALKQLPNKFAFVECNSPEVEFPKEHYFNVLKKKYYPRSQAAFFQTKEEKDYYSFLPDTKKYIIPNPVNNIDLPYYNGIRRKIVVTFCRLKKQKRIPFLIEAFSIFLKDFPDYQLHIYGDGPEKENIINIINDFELNTSVKLFDFDINVHQKIYDCAMYVSPSLFEGMSNSMLEAMSIGLPVICTDCYGGGAKAVIKNGENGLLVPVEDVNALSKAMVLIADDEELANKLSKNAVLVKNRLSKNTICTLWREALEEIWNL